MCQPGLQHKRWNFTKPTNEQEFQKYINNELKEARRKDLSTIRQIDNGRGSNEVLGTKPRGVKNSSSTKLRIERNASRKNIKKSKQEKITQNIKEKQKLFC